MFTNKNACSVSLESKRPGVDSVKEKLLVGRLYFKIMSEGFLWTEAHSSSFAGDS